MDLQERFSHSSWKTKNYLFVSGGFVSKNR